MDLKIKQSPPYDIWVENFDPASVSSQNWREAFHLARFCFPERSVSEYYYLETDGEVYLDDLLLV